MHSAPAGWGKRDDMVVHDDDPFNCEPPPAVLADVEITAVESFYCRNHGPIPDIAPADWRLEVDGDVTQPLTLSYPELTTGFPAYDVTATLQCAGNRRAELLRIHPMPGKEPWAQGAISTALWHGVRLADVLRTAGIRRAGDSHAAFTGADIAPHAHPPQAFGGSIPLRKAMSGEVLLAFQMNDQPLLRLHGGPVRLVAPGFIGARSVKWLTGITVQPAPSSNYFQAVDYRVHDVELSTLPLNCAILTPDDGARIPAGPLSIRGYAIAEDCRRIARVQVSLDGGVRWHPAELAPACNPWTWRHWAFSTTVDPGPLTIAARAYDDAGLTHPESTAALWNPGGYANNSWARVDLTAG